MTIRTGLLLLGIALVLLPLPVQAQDTWLPPTPVREQLHPWRLTFTADTPELYIWTTPSGDSEYYWYMTYRLENNSGTEAPLVLDIVMQIDGEEQYINTYSPLVEEAIICRLERLGGIELVPAHADEAAQQKAKAELARARLQQLKEQGKYMNVRDLRAKGRLADGESLEGLALFRDVRRRMSDMQIQLGGLVDPRRYNTRKFDDPSRADEPLFLYQAEVLVLNYVMPADEFHLHLAMLEYRGKAWKDEEFGVLGGPRMIPKLLNALAHENAVVRRAAAGILSRLLPEPPAEYAYRASASVEENQQAIWWMKEWWIRNEDKIKFDPETGKYTAQEK